MYHGYSWMNGLRGHWIAPWYCQQNAEQDISDLPSVGSALGARHLIREGLTYHSVGFRWHNSQRRNIRHLLGSQRRNSRHLLGGRGPRGQTLRFHRERKDREERTGPCRGSARSGCRHWAQNCDPRIGADPSGCQIVRSWLHDAFRMTGCRHAESKAVG